MKTPSLIELRDRLNSIIRENEELGRDERNHRPVYVRLTRSGRGSRDWFIPVKYMSSAMYTIKGDEAEDIQCFMVNTDEETAIKPTRERAAKISAQTNAKIKEGVTFSVETRENYAYVTFHGNGARYCAELFAEQLVKDGIEKSQVSRLRRSQTVYVYHPEARNGLEVLVKDFME
jgi:hypothetical protein